MTRVVYEDVCLAEYEYDGLTGFRTTTYSLEVSVNHIAGMEVAEAISDAA